MTRPIPSPIETYLEAWCRGRTWTAAQAQEIRDACARWDIDPARFGVPADVSAAVRAAVGAPVRAAVGAA